ncbi:MAG TPA: winged helix-turn-helix domain-containing protein [Thermoplasmata archaeon]|nr:winged helix-turn-helix domain-containing protein [Thermoplasmata archaeon]
MMSPGFRSLMWYLLFGTRGGPNRRRLLETLVRSPANAHQLAESIGLDYRTVRHHLRLLERHGAVSRPVGDAYATPYEISAAASAYLETLDPRPPGNVRGRSTPRPDARPAAARAGGFR